MLLLPAGYRLSGPHESSHESAKGHRYDEVRLAHTETGAILCLEQFLRLCVSQQGAVVLDPYAKAVLSRKSFGELGRVSSSQPLAILGHYWQFIG